MNIRKSILLVITVIITVLLITIGVSYAYFTANLTGGEAATTVTLTGGTMNITYNGGANINALNIFPQADPFATKTFTVTGNNTTDVEMLYNISLVVEESTFSYEALKYKLVSTNTNNNGTVAPSISNLINIGSNNRIISLGTGSFTSPTGGAKIHTYKLELYFPNEAYNQNIDQGKNFKAYVSIKNASYIGYDSTTEVNKPVLFTGMTPVKWNGTAFVNTTADDPTWYNYNNKEWANAKTQDGSYWVWIPRYAYKITSGYNSTTTGTIDVKFLKGTSIETQDGTKIENSGYVAGVKDTSMNYFLHPAFEFNGDELGFWVAKYEPTAAEGVASDATTCSGSDNVTTKTVKIEPNKTAWRCINIATANTVSQEMKNKTAVYGWLSNEVDSHMMKNSEWGAVTYLSKSKYGADTNEVWNNAYNQYQTGCSGSGVNASSEATCITYETTNGQKASTTHNITGVYDMSGGAWERTMSNYNSLGASSGLNTTQINSLNTKYISRYGTRTENMLNGVGMDYDLNIYGDAVYETSNGAARYDGTSYQGKGAGSWYGDYSYLPYASYPWFNRGGIFSYGATAGLFAFHVAAGSAGVECSFRPVLFAE